MTSTSLFQNPPAPRRFYWTVGLSSGLAWALLAAWQRSAYTGLLGHEVLEAGQVPPAFHLAAFLLSWSLMTVAMMLPPSLPAFGRYVQPAGVQAKDRRAAGLLLGYLVPWVLFGLLVYLGDSVLHHLAEPGGPLGALSSWIAPALVLAAGLYQFTPAKRHALARSHARSAGDPLCAGGGPGGAGVLEAGLRLGADCLGSCWPLMLLLFALGLHRLDWMLALSGLLAAERLTPWGPRLAGLVGLALSAWALLWMLNVL